MENNHEWKDKLLNLGIKENEELIAELFNFYLDFILKNNAIGACHDLSSIFYITLSEYGFHPTIYTGVVRSPDGSIFDHSWVEINGKVYDIAICLPLSEGKYVSPPIFASKNIENGNITDLQFGIKCKLEDDIQRITEISLTEYINDYTLGIPLYELITTCAASMSGDNKKNLSIAELEKKYSSHKRLVKADIN